MTHIQKSRKEIYFKYPNNYYHSIIQGELKRKVNMKEKKIKSFLKAQFS